MTLTVGNYTVSKDLLVDLTRLRAPEGQHDLVQEPAGFPLHFDWKLHFHSASSVTGYDGALFSAQIDGKEHYFIFHQGTNDAKDFPSLMKLANNQTPIQHRDACRFTDRAMAFIHTQHPEEADIPIVQVGYSLGGALAISACKDQQPVIAFEPPGMKGVIANQGRDPEKVGQHILEILSPHPNVVNAHGTHVGQLLVPGQKDWKTTRCTIRDFIRLTSATHHIADLGDRIEQTHPLKTQSVAEADRPNTVFEAFQQYLDDCQEMDVSTRKRLLEGFIDVLVETGIDQKLTRGVLVIGDEVANWLAEEIYGKEAVERQRDLAARVKQSAEDQQRASGFTQKLTQSRGAAQDQTPGR